MVVSTVGFLSALGGLYSVSLAAALPSDCWGNALIYNAAMVRSTFGVGDKKRFGSLCPLSLDCCLQTCCTFLHVIVVVKLPWRVLANALVLFCRQRWTTPFEPPPKKNVGRTIAVLLWLPAGELFNASGSTVLCIAMPAPALDWYI